MTTHIIDASQRPPVLQRTLDPPSDISVAALTAARLLLRMKEGTHLAVITRKGGRVTVEPVQLVQGTTWEIGE